MELPFDPAIPLLGIYLKNPKSPIKKNLCTPMFIAALFTVARKKEGTPTFCDSMNGTGEYYAK